MSERDHADPFFCLLCLHSFFWCTFSLTTDGPPPPRSPTPWRRRCNTLISTMGGAGGRPKGRKDNPLNKRTRRGATEEEKKQQQARSNATKKRNDEAKRVKEKEEANKKRPAGDFLSIRDRRAISKKAQHLPRIPRRCTNTTHRQEPSRGTRPPPPKSSTIARGRIPRVARRSGARSIAPNVAHPGHPKAPVRWRPRATPLTPHKSPTRHTTTIHPQG